MKALNLIISPALFACFCAGVAPAQTATAATPPTANTSSSELRTPEEKHLRNVRQLTFGGSNAEAYFSADGKRLIFQSTRDNLQCDQIFIMNADGSDQKMVSTGKGRTTCGYFLADGKHIVYASTHGAGDACPTP